MQRPKPPARNYAQRAPPFRCREEVKSGLCTAMRQRHWFGWQGQGKRISWRLESRVEEPSPKWSWEVSPARCSQHRLATYCWRGRRSDRSRCDGRDKRLRVWGQAPSRIVPRLKPLSPNGGPTFGSDTTSQPDRRQAQRLRTNSARRTRPLIASCRQSISCGLSVSRIDRITVPCLSVWPAPFTFRSLTRTTASPLERTLPEASRTTVAAAADEASCDAGAHYPVAPS